MDPSLLRSFQDWLIAQGPEMAFDLIAFLIILVVGFFVVKLSRLAFDRTLRRSDRVNELLRGFAVDVLGKSIWVLVAVIALGQLGLNIGPLIAGLGVVGFVLGFAFKDALGNLASGVMILLNSPFEVGNFVEIAGHSGKIQDLNLMATIIATSDNKRVTIPNSSVWGSSIINFSAHDTRRVDMSFGIGYEDDIEKASHIIHEILSEHELILEEPRPVVELHELADSSVNFVVRPWVKTDDYWRVHWDLTQAVKQRFDEADISIPYPQLEVHHHEVPTLPET